MIKVLGTTENIDRNVKESQGTPNFQMYQVEVQINFKLFLPFFIQTGNSRICHKLLFEQLFNRTLLHSNIYVTQALMLLQQRCI